MAEPDLGSELREEFEGLVSQLTDAIAKVIRETDDRPALPDGFEASLTNFFEPLPQRGIGAAATIERLLELNERAGGNTAGPRCFHLVIGGSTPAAHAADLLAAAYDAITYTWITSPVGVQMEQQALDWMKEMFGLPKTWAGIIVTGATMANFVGIAAARQWWGEQHGVDVSETGLSGLPRMPVLTSGFVHAATLKVMAMQGIGRASVQRFARDEVGRLDLGAMERALQALEGGPAVVVVNAGEVNAGEFDPVKPMIELARAYNCWVHVDGAFGIFARISPRTEHLVEGLENADSAAVDGHKWLNVPYDSGYAFVRDHRLMAQAFRYSADYLPAENDPRPTPGAIGPESSRRARSFAVWATLRAYGVEGHRRIVEHCLDIARYCADKVAASERLELLNEVQLNIVSMRYNPGGLTETQLDDLNTRLGDAILRGGRFMVGTSKLGRQTILRPAFSNWRTRREDIDEFIELVLSTGRQVSA
jgi:glutamate/tyrosine decarboxylase-like PLP-dependent enzyme